jgi:hypothetical protein
LRTSHPDTGRPHAAPELLRLDRLASAASNYQFGESVMAHKSKNPTPPTTKPAAPRTATPAATADKISLSSGRTPTRPTPSEDQIRARAYFLWEQAGRPEGDGAQFWLEAEKELSNPR